MSDFRLRLDRGLAPPLSSCANSILGSRIVINSAIITLTTQVCGERREKMCEKSAYSKVLHLRGTWPMEAIEIGERERGMLLCLLHRSSHTLYCWLDPSHCITFSSFAEQKEILLLAKGLLDLRSQF